MYHRAIKICAYLLLIVGVTIFLTHSVMLCHNETKQYKAVKEYIAAAEEIDDTKNMLAEAEDFNIKLYSDSKTLKYLTKEQLGEYNSCLDIMGNGMIGCISVPDEGILLPIYHGMGEESMMSGAGHLEGSSFPISGESVHSVIVGHRALATARMFFDLGRVKTGEKFTVYVLNTSCTYQVNGIETVKPGDVRSLFVQEGKNLCSLVTCTPYGSESHRLLIHGELVDAKPDIAQALKAANMRLWIYRAVIAVELLIIIIIIVFAIKYIRKKQAE